MSALDLTAIRARLGGARGADYWRSLEELAETPEFVELLEREFPQGASVWFEGVSRRRFVQLMGASLGLAGIAGCTRQPLETIVPYVKQPEEIVPGKPLFFATATLLRGIACGVLAESHMGRPTKIEGNPDHPASLGGSDPFGQGWVLGLYDPDRAKVLTEAGRIRPWSAFVGLVREKVSSQTATKGAGLRILTGSVTSPTLARQLRAVSKAFPEAKWHQYEPASRDNALEGARLAFGEPVATRVDLDQADVIVTLDADFMMGQPDSLKLVRQFAARRRVAPGAPGMNRLYAVESSPTITGARADHRVAVRPSEVESIARALAARLGVGPAAEASEAAKTHAAWIDAVAADLEKRRGKSVVLAGDEQPAAVHALAHALNHALGNAGKTVAYTEPVEAKPVAQTESLRDLVADLSAGKVDLLVILGGNPVYDAPADLDFKAAIQKATVRVRLGMYDDETSELCHWQVPEAHPLETWGDALAFDGTATVLQPLIEPLYAGKSAIEVVSALFEPEPKSGHDLVRATWKERVTSDFDSFWRRSLHDGIVPGTSFPAKEVHLKDGLVASLPKPVAPKGLEIAFRVDASVYDGRFANNGWLQELPRPLTKLTWDNVALVAPRTAEEMRLDNGEIVELKLDGRSVKAPVWIQPGHPQGSVTVHLGYGRRRAGRVGDGAGFDAYAIRTSTAPWNASGLDVVKSGDSERFRLAQTQVHHSMEGRHLVRSAPLAHYREHPDFARHLGEEEPAKGVTLYPEWKYEGYAWAMAIDLSTCIGCNACTIACVAENNIAVVGKDQVARGREMHWIRVDRYFKGDLDDPEIVHQPVPCMQCENAPCEPVCPVGATNHSAEGLNDMVYNRCVGTRYCSNNCPYKVRRFNFYLYSDFETESLKGVRNPDVTVRSRGVMEKCTYCVQRVNAAKIEAEKQDRRVRDGEIQTACQQACPADAIVFGDQNDPDSRVAKLKKDPRNYALLAELNTRPRTTYLAEVRNPNPALGGGASDEEQAHHG